MDGISEIGGKEMISRVSAKKQASMEQVAPITEIKPTDAMQQLDQLQEQFDYAFGLMQDVRAQVEGALDKLNPSR